MKSNVLVFPAGEINSVELHDALSNNVNIEVFGASSKERHGSYVFKNYRGGLPLITDDSFIAALNQLIKEWHIDFIFPTHDTVSLFLAKKQSEIHAKVIVADIYTAEVCRSKKKTYQLFKEYGFCPEQYENFNHLPCFIKPDDGQGAVGAKIIHSAHDIPENFDFEEYVIMELLPGDEMTVDCLTDYHGNLCAVLPRKRLRLFSGVSVAGVNVKCDEEVKGIAESINSRLKFFGLWYFQIKRDYNGKYKLLEISTRCAGTMCLSRARGINLPLLSVYTAQGKDISVFENPYTVVMDRTLISRYKMDYDYSTVYIDYDDTVVSGECTIPSVIRYLYQCKNQHKKIILITRHNEDHEDELYQSLYQHCIFPALFDQIISLSFKQEKVDFIDPLGAIFIDNSFAERKKVFDKYAIPVFDVEGIEVLLDWRE